MAKLLLDSGLDDVTDQLRTMRPSTLLPDLWLRARARRPIHLMSTSSIFKGDDRGFAARVFGTARRASWRDADHGGFIEGDG